MKTVEPEPVEDILPDRRRVQDASNAREQEAQLMIDGMPVGAAIVSSSGDVEALNKHMLDYFGSSLGVLKTWMTTGALVHPDDFRRAAAEVQRGLATGEAHAVEARLRRSDGAYRWFHVRAHPAREGNGSIVRWCVVYIDIDDRKRAEDALAANERNLNLILHTIPAFIHVLGTDGSVRYVNQAVFDFTGLTSEDVGKEDYRARLFHADDLVRVHDERLAALRRPVLFELQMRIRGKDGRYHWFLNRYSPWLDEQGTLDRWYAVSFNIDDLKRAEAELQQTNDFFEEAQRLGRTGSFITDLDGDEHLWSEEARRIWGFGRDDQLTVADIRARIHPDDLDGFDASAALSLRGAQSVTHDFRVLVDGATRHLRLAAHAQERNGHRSFAGALQDVTDQKLAEAALDHARSELAHASRTMSLGVLTASIAHEVNQPLSGIVTNANTCLRMLDCDPPNLEGARDTARRTIRDGKRASEIISRLRTLFAKNAIAAEDVDLNEAVREVIALSRHELQRHSISLTTNFDNALPMVKGDRVQLQQVIINLLLNAADAVNHVEKRARRISVETRFDDDHALINIRDSGVGLPKEASGKLFEAFFTTKPEGMGIGLSVSRSIIERHSGRLWAADNDGPGATFSVSIPCTTCLAPSPTADGGQIWTAS